MNVISPNGVKIYNLSGGRSLPQWISDKKKAALKKDKEFSRRIELIQDFQFPTAGHKFKISSDGQFIAGVGTYKPRVRVWDLNELSLKFERYLDHNVEQFQLLSSDYSKIVFLRGDRVLEFHAQFGTYYATRIPNYGRDMLYNSRNCEIYVGCTGSEVYRLSLEYGRFMGPLETGLENVNVCGQNPAHGLLGFGGDGGLVEMWDPRSHKCVGSLNVGSEAVLQSSDRLPEIPSVTALRFHEDGLRFATGTSTGQILLYDLRSSKPLHYKEHQYGLPIVDLKYSHETEHIISTDQRIIKVWNEKTGSILASIEPKWKINDVLYVPQSGMLMATGESSKIETYFIPALGPAPSWCSFLENLTEELEEDKQPLFDDYKFVTRLELEKMGLEKMIGTEYLRAYMHGFFMDQTLYSKVKSLSDQFSWEQFKDQHIAKALPEKTSRIAVQRKATSQKINKELAENNVSLVADPRFAKLFTSADFTIDKNSAEFTRVQPRTRKAKKEEQAEPQVSVTEYFDRVEEEAEDDSGNEDDSSKAGESQPKRVKRSADELIAQPRKQTSNPESKKSQLKLQRKKLQDSLTQPEMMEVKTQEEHALRLGTTGLAGAKPLTGSFARQMKAGLHERRPSKSVEGNAVITGVSSAHVANQRRLQEQQEQRNETYRRKQRRSVTELGLRKIK